MEDVVILDKMKLYNLVNGEKSYGRQQFTVTGMFGKKKITLPNSNKGEIGDAIRGIDEAPNECYDLSVKRRIEILRNAFKYLNLTTKQKEFICSFTGNPRRLVNKQHREARNLLKFMAGLGEEYSHLGNSLLEDTGHGKIYYTPSQNLASLWLPQGDLREGPWALSQAVLAGIRLFIKLSSEDPIMGLKTAEALIKAGYPKSGINIFYWDTNDESRENLGNFLYSRTQQGIYMGSREKADKMFGDGSMNDIIFSHGHGRCIIGPDADLETVTDELITSMLASGNCMTTRQAYVHERVHDKYIEKMNNKLRNYEEQAEQLCRLHNLNNNGADHLGYLMDENTEIGLLPESDVDTIEGLKNMVNLGKIEILQGKRLSPNLVSLYHILINDMGIGCLSSQIPNTILTKKVKSLDQSVEYVNRSLEETKEQEALIVSIYGYSQEETERVVPNLKTCAVNQDKSTDYMNHRMPHGKERKIMMKLLTEQKHISL